MTTILPSDIIGIRSSVDGRYIGFDLADHVDLSIKDDDNFVYLDTPKKAMTRAWSLVRGERRRRGEPMDTDDVLVDAAAALNSQIQIGFCVTRKEKVSWD